MKDLPEGYYEDLKILEHNNNITNKFLNSLLDSESYYLELLEAGWKPQQARQVLPNALKTELIMCGYPKDWGHFFDLRLASNAHPSAQQCAELINQVIYATNGN